MSAMWPCTICSSPRRAEQLPLAGVAALSSSARRAKPSAAAPTVARNTSSVAIAMRKPSPGSPIIAPRRARAVLEGSRASGCGAIDFERSAIVKPVVGGNEEGRNPLGTGGLTGAGKDDVEISDAAIGDPGLLAVEHIAIAAAGQPCAILATSEPERGSDSAKAAIAVPARVRPSHRVLLGAAE